MQTERSALPPGWEALTDATINAVMRALCVPTKLLGYRYIFFAVRTIRTEPDRDRAARRDMYAEIGSCMGTTRPMISRTIRYAVGQAWKHAAPEVLTSYLGSRRAAQPMPKRAKKRGLRCRSADVCRLRA